MIFSVIILYVVKKIITFVGYKDTTKRVIHEIKIIILCTERTIAVNSASRMWVRR